MTLALCLSCGRVKFGAICPCANCGVDSCGDTELDIAFSDHYIAKPSLDALSELFQTIAAATEDRQLRFWTFMNHVGPRHPLGLTLEMKPEGKEKVEAFLATLTLPEVAISPGYRLLRRNDERPPPGKRWWEFWRRE